VNGNSSLTLVDYEHRDQKSYVGEVRTVNGNSSLTLVDYEHKESRSLTSGKYGQ